MSYFLDSPKAGWLMVVSGQATNMYREPVSRIKLRGILHTTSKQNYVAKTVYAGRFLSDGALRSMDREAIDQHLAQPPKVNEFTRIHPLGQARFTFVFFNLPKGLEAFTLQVAEPMVNAPSSEFARLGAAVSGNLPDLPGLIASADNGDPEIQIELGDMLTSGKFISKDSNAGIKWYRRAAEQGHPAAQFKVGTLFLLGLGVAMDEKEAVKWYRLAAEQGFLKAQLQLASLLAREPLGSPERGEALRWYRAAAQGGDAQAGQAYGRMLLADVIFDSDVAALLKTLAHMEAACSSIDCVFNALWEFADVSRDGKISLAELARVQRIILKYGISDTADKKLDLEDKLGISLVGILVSPILGSAVLNSMDYDNDGFLAKEEVLANTELAEIVGVSGKDVRKGIDMKKLEEKVKELGWLFRILVGKE